MHLHEGVEGAQVVEGSPRLGQGGEDGEGEGEEGEEGEASHGGGGRRREEVEGTAVHRPWWQEPAGSLCKPADGPREALTIHHTTAHYSAPHTTHHTPHTTHHPTQRRFRRLRGRTGFLTVLIAHIGSLYISMKLYEIF